MVLLIAFIASVFLHYEKCQLRGSIEPTNIMLCAVMLMWMIESGGSNLAANVLIIAVILT